VVSSDRRETDVARRDRRARWPLVVVLAAVLAGAAAPASAGAAAGIAWTACSGAPRAARGQCARVRVPLDWSRPRGATISLKVIRRLASRRGQRIGSMLFNPGGPGVSGVRTVSDPGEGAQLDRAAGGRFDIVSWDPRGTNASTPVRCFATSAQLARFWGPDPFPLTRAESLATLSKLAPYARRCRKRSC